jgi:2-amino-4-hydroxy-6-hydroxymethyldihydropteridine diphosphokinase
VRQVIVGLGSNLGDRAESLASAVAQLAAHPQIVIEARSSVVATAALTEPGAAPQPDFLNAAVRLHTTLAAEALLDVLLEVERSLGRVRNERWGARTIDLDVLWINGETLHTARLHVPHPGLSTRSFALFPLLEVLDPDDPGGPELRAQSLLLEPPRRVGALTE